MLQVDADARMPGFSLRASFQVPQGCLLAVFGPSGAGKSTLLKVIAGVGPPGPHRIRWQGQVWAAPGRSPVPAWRRPVGWLPQTPRLLPHRRVAGNLLLVPGSTREEARAALATVGLLPRWEAWPEALSGGERQRVALARLLLRRPEVALLDEPWAGLDAPSAEEVRTAVLSALAGPGRVVILVTHDWGEVERVADRVVVLRSGQVAQEGSPAELVARPRDLHVARLVGYVGALSVRGTRYGVHPGRVLPGAHPERGPVVPVLAGRPGFFGGRAVVWCTLAPHLQVPLPGHEAPPAVTLDHPPAFPDEG